MPALPGRIGRYEIVDRLGEGGMGVVYRAHDPQLHRTVAIKVLSAQGDSEMHQQLRERFAREASSVASLKHHHIVIIYDVGEDAGRPFIAMEFLDGESLADLIKREGSLTREDKIRLSLELCSGLGYAHRRGIVHRDIKPANLMVTGDGVLKILDFGLARMSADVTHAGLTQAGTLLGTPNYMSPEQVMGQTVDHRSDIFAVGAVLYELFSGHRAFEADAPTLVLVRILNTVPTPIGDLVPNLPIGLDAAITRALARDPERRYQTLEDLASDLRRIALSTGALPEATLQMLAPAFGTAIQTTPVALPTEPAFAPSMGAGATIVMPVKAPPAPVAIAPPRADAPGRGSTRALAFALAALAVAIVAGVLYVTVMRRDAASIGGQSLPAATVAPASSPASEPPPAPAAASSPAGGQTPPEAQAPPDVVPGQTPANAAPIAATPPAAARPRTATQAAVPAPEPTTSGPGGGTDVAGGRKDADAPAKSAVAPPPAAAASTPAAPRSAPKTPEIRARCSQLLERLGLGESLSAAENDFLNQQCRN